MPTLRTTGSEVYYELSGAGAPVLWIQGAAVTGEAWRLQVRHFDSGYQNLIFDNRGIGRSVPFEGPISIEAMADDVRCLMREVGWSSAHIVGHSMGGLIAQQFAIEEPQRVRSLSLLCTFDRGSSAVRLTPWVLWITLRTRLGPRWMRRRAFLEMLMPRTVLWTEDLDKLADHVGKLVGRDLADQPPVLMRQMGAMRRHDVSNRLAALAGIPTLVMSAAQDPIAPPRFGQRLARLIPGARFEQVEAASHAMMIHSPERTNRRLGEFLSGCEQRHAARVRVPPLSSPQPAIS